MEPVILKGRQVRREQAKPQRIAQAVAMGDACVPTVRSLMDDGVVRAIEVTCSCGEKTTVDLVHGAAAPPTS